MSNHSDSDDNVYGNNEELTVPCLGEENSTSPLTAVQEDDQAAGVLSDTESKEEEQQQQQQQQQQYEGATEQREDQVVISNNTVEEDDESSSPRLPHFPPMEELELQQTQQVRQHSQVILALVNNDDQQDQDAVVDNEQSQNDVVQMQQQEDLQHQGQQSQSSADTSYPQQQTKPSPKNTSSRAQERDKNDDDDDEDDDLVAAAVPLSEELQRQHTQEVRDRSHEILTLTGSGDVADETKEQEKLKMFDAVQHGSTTTVRDDSSETLAVAGLDEEAKEEEKDADSASVTQVAYEGVEEISETPRVEATATTTTMPSSSIVASSSHPSNPSSVLSLSRNDALDSTGTALSPAVVSEQVSDITQQSLTLRASTTTTSTNTNTTHIEEPVAIAVEESDEDDDENTQHLEETILESIRQQAVVAKEVKNPCDKMARVYRKVAWTVLFIIVCVIVGTTAGLLVRNSRSSNAEQQPTTRQPPTNNSTDPSSVSTLDTIVDAGVLRCGMKYYGNFSYQPEVDMCSAMAAAIFGDATKYEIVAYSLVDAFVALQSRAFDLYFGVAPTMDRDIYERSAGAGFSFTIPFYYMRLGIGGMSPFVDCADELRTDGNCSSLSVCVVEGSASKDRLELWLPKSHTVPRDIDKMLSSFLAGECNTVLGNIVDLEDGVNELRKQGMDVKVGQRIVEYEALGFATRDEDPVWSDFVNWVLMALMDADERGVTQDTADKFPITSVFGDKFENMFRNAIAAVGTYEDIIARFFEGQAATRSPVNFVNHNASSGLLMSPDFGYVSTLGPGPNAGGHLERMAQRGNLTCGIIGRQPGFVAYDLDTGKWQGLDIDFCRAVSAGLFFSQIDDIDFVEYNSPEEAFVALSDGQVDIVAGLSANLVRDVLEPTSGAGFSFSLPYFYNNTRLDETRTLATQQDDRQWSSFVYWIVASTIYAEERQITKANSNEMPAVNLLGSAYQRIFRDAILTVGNYGDMYARNVELFIPRGGRNLLNTLLNNAPVGPQLRTLPFD